MHAICKVVVQPPSLDTEREVRESLILIIVMQSKA